MAGGGGNIAEILRKYTLSIKALAKKVCPINCTRTIYHTKEPLFVKITVI